METFNLYILPIISVIIGAVSASLMDLFIEKKREKKNKIDKGKLFLQELFYYKVKYPYKDFNSIDEIPDTYKKGLPVNNEFNNFLISKEISKSSINKLIYSDLFENSEEAKNKLLTIEKKLEL